MNGTIVRILLIAFALSSTVALAKGGGAKAEYAGQTCTNNGNQRFCMICNVYFESRGEPYKGKVAVARVVLTRKKHDDYPNTECKVIYQRKQFSWTSKGGRRLPTSGASYQALKDSIRAVDEAYKLGASGNTHFHGTHVSPHWRRSCDGNGQIGAHLFYRCDATIDQLMASSSGLDGRYIDPYSDDVATSGAWLEDDPDAFIDDRGLLMEREENARNGN